MHNHQLQKLQQDKAIHATFHFSTVLLHKTAIAEVENSLFTLSQLGQGNSVMEVLQTDFDDEIENPINYELI
jgi:hypothetical protein